MEGMSVLMGMLMTVVLPLLVGGMLAATPWLMRSRECFAVTVPAEAQRAPEVVRLKRGYAVAMGALALAGTAAGASLFAAGHAEAALIASVVACCVLPLVSFALMLRARRRVQALKEERGWRAEGDRRSAVVAEGDLPRALPLSWELLHLPIIVATLVLGIVFYADMPDVVPMHVDFEGNVNGWSEKSPLLACLVPIVQLFMLACFVLSHVTILKSKRPSMPDAPVTSAYAYGVFARAQSAFLVALGLLLNAGFIGMQLAVLGKVSLLAAGVTLGAIAVLAVVGAIILAVVYGQSGARVMARVGDEGAVPADEDRYWRCGVFYVNRDDPSLFVPDRFGVGWSCNFGRPMAWALLAAILALTAGFIVLVVVLV